MSTQQDPWDPYTAIGNGSALASYIFDAAGGGFGGLPWGSSEGVPNVYNQPPWNGGGQMPILDPTGGAGNLEPGWGNYPPISQQPGAIDLGFASQYEGTGFSGMGAVMSGFTAPPGPQDPASILAMLQRYGYSPGTSPESQIVGGLGGKRSLRQSGGTFLTEPLRGYASGAAAMAGGEIPGALAASKGLDMSDPYVARAARDQWLRTVLGGYTDTPYVDEEAGRAADIAQRGIAGMMKNYGGGAYAKSILDTRAKAALDVRGRERAYQNDALGLAPSIYDVATRPQQDLYRRFVTDPVEISGRYGQALTQNPLSREELTYGKTKKAKKKFDWGGFAASAANSYLNSGGGGGGWGAGGSGGVGGVYGGGAGSGGDWSFS